MARARGAKQKFNFVGGWNTESSPMTFPDNAAQDLDNVIIDVDGSIRRRPGADFELPFTKFGLALSDNDRRTLAITTHSWETAAGIANFDFLVTQIGNTLYLQQQNGLSTSSGTLFSVDFSGQAVRELVNSLGAIETLDRSEIQKVEPVQTSAGLGVLFVVGKFIKPFYIEMTGSVDVPAFTLNSIEVEVRDFEGLDDGLAVNNRPSSNTNLHNYNLKNQGWPTSFTVWNDSNGDNQIITNPIQHLKDKTGIYPSNADIFYLGKNASAKDIEQINAFDPFAYDHNVFGNTPAPKGHFILNAWTKDRREVSLIDFTTTAYTVYGRGNVATRPSTVAFHQGRVFYAGLEDSKATGNVYFSQILDAIDNAGKCYQEQDPTAEDFNSLLETDGGLIPIPGCGKILRLLEVSNGVVVLANNGVWIVSGKEGFFTPTNFSVNKVSNIGCVGARTAVEAEGAVLYWSAEGIILLSPSEVTGQLNAQNLTERTIQTGYLQIGTLQQRGAQGVYIPEEKKAYWIYSTNSAYDNVTDRYRFNGLLILDFSIQAFYKWSVSDTANTAPYISGVYAARGVTSVVATNVVTVDGIDVTVNGVDVTVDETEFSSSSSATTSLRFLAQVDSDTASSFDFTLGQFSSSCFKEWTKASVTDGEGVDYSSFVETGFDLFQNAMVDKSPVYIFTYFSKNSKSRQTGGYHTLPVCLPFTQGARFTQSAKETLGTFDSQMRITQAVKETVGAFDSQMRVTQIVKEVLIG